MNNEPVAWINRRGKSGEHGYLEWDKDDSAEVNTPLYTHPAKTLTMTFEEMLPIAEKHLGHAIGLYNWYIYGNAILRKAQEK